MKVYLLVVLVAVVAIFYLLKKKEGFVVPPILEHRTMSSLPMNAISGLSDAYTRSSPMSDPSMFRDMVPVDQPEQVAKDRVYGEYLTPQDMLGEQTMDVADQFAEPEVHTFGVTLKSRFISPDTVWNLGAEYIPPVNSVHSFRDIGLGDAPRTQLSQPMDDGSYSYEVTRV